MLVYLFVPLTDECYGFGLCPERVWGLGQLSGFRTVLEVSRKFRGCWGYQAWVYSFFVLAVLPCFGLNPWLLMRQQLRGPVSDTKPSQLATRAWKAPSSSPTSDPATDFFAHPVQPLPDQSMIREQVLLVMRNNFTEFGVRPSTPISMLRISPVPLPLRLPQIRTHHAQLSGRPQAESLRSQHLRTSSP